MTIESIHPDDFQNEIWDTNTILIDVRTKEEKEKFWYIENTDLFLNMYEENFFATLWKLEKNKRYLIYCWHANRTWFLLNFMKNSWFEYVKDLLWWTENWENSWLPLIKD